MPHTLRILRPLPSLLTSALILLFLKEKIAAHHGDMTDFSTAMTIGVGIVGVTSSP